MPERKFHTLSGYLAKAAPRSLILRCWCGQNRTHAAGIAGADGDRPGMLLRHRGNDPPRPICPVFSADQASCALPAPQSPAIGRDMRFGLQATASCPPGRKTGYARSDRKIFRGKRTTAQIVLVKHRFGYCIRRPNVPARVIPIELDRNNDARANIGASPLAGCRVEFQADPKIVSGHWLLTILFRRYPSPLGAAFHALRDLIESLAPGSTAVSRLATASLTLGDRSLKSVVGSAVKWRLPPEVSVSDYHVQNINPAIYLLSL